MRNLDTEAPPSTTTYVVDYCSGSEATTASPESPRPVRCVAGPARPEAVFDDEDGKCAEQAKLSSTAAATLKPSSAALLKNSLLTYQLVVEKAPHYDTPLSYKCVTPDPASQTSAATSTGSAFDEEKHCLMKITVKGPSGEAASETTMGSVSRVLT
ncbi:SAG-related sequence [Besnoitia besnoiti]|uniref:SAG-related sequence n=1 Tax=Besnoitia besnoiti TaxID=94643 RepID=A0A2A9MEL4_BESBE|nr:SAG-related sequence [Besnoitia besnoiti]PFH36948.1 SAG-related sequence [Besnoitia besnoiti]